jgi:hypothetical protein
MMHYNIMDYFIKCLQDCTTVEGMGGGGGGLVITSCFQKVKDVYITVNVKDFCYMLMCQLILFIQ